MKAQVLDVTFAKPIVISDKTEIAIKIILFVAILTCINLVAFM